MIIFVLSMQDAKNILMILYHNYLFDARVRREAELLAGMKDYNICVLTPKLNKYPQKFDIEGVRIREINEGQYDGKNKFKYSISYLKFMFFCFFVCVRRTLNGTVDIVHIHNLPNFLVFSAIIPWLFGKKIILDIHDSIPETYEAKFPNKSRFIFKLLCLEESWSAFLSKKIICVNHVQKEILLNRKISKDKIAVSMNIPDPKYFSKIAQKISPNKNPASFKMIYHGTIAKRLGVDLIIKTVAQIYKEIPELEFHLWSKACDELDYIEKLCRNLKVVDRVHIIRGGVPLEKLSLELMKMDLGIIGNRKNKATELMLPVKMLEYVAMHIPVVAPRLRCIEYYFTDEMVTFFEPENIDSMAEAISGIYKNKERRLKQSQKALAFFDQYGWMKHKKDFISLYQEI